MLHFLPEIKITASEEAIIAEKLSNPVVKKFLNKMALIITTDILVDNEPKDNESADSFLRRQAHETGKLATINQLLAIEPASQEPKSVT